MDSSLPVGLIQLCFYFLLLLLLRSQEAAQASQKLAKKSWSERMLLLLQGFWQDRENKRAEVEEGATSQEMRPVAVRGGNEKVGFYFEHYEKKEGRWGRGKSFPFFCHSPSRDKKSKRKEERRRGGKVGKLGCSLFPSSSPLPLQLLSDFFILPLLILLRPPFKRRRKKAEYFVRPFS